MTATYYLIAAIALCLFLILWVGVTVILRGKKSGNRDVQNIVAHDQFSKDIRISDGKIIRLATRIEVLEHGTEEK